jgi:hypothetical protein
MKKEYKSSESIIKSPQKINFSTKEKKLNYYRGMLISVDLGLGLI